MPLIIPANSAVGGGYDVDNSLRFNDGSSDYLSKTFSSETNRKTYTISVWVKRSSTADESFIIAADASAGGGNTRDFIRIEGTDQLRYTIGGGGAADIKTTQLFRDVSAWYSIIISVDTTQGTASNRVKIYVNGLQVTNFATSSYPSQNAVGDFNDNILHRVGIDTNNTSNGWSGYMSEFVFIDGQQLAADQFGEFDEDSGIWKPIDVSGLTFGNNGFYLEFKQAGTGTNSSGMGADTSGEDNHFAVNNLTAIDQSTDTCTNNFATMNPLGNYYPNSTFSEGNLKMVTSGSSSTYSFNLSTIGVSSGKWYWETKVTKSSVMSAGISSSFSTSATDEIFSGADGYAYASNGNVYNNGSAVLSSMPTYTTGDIIGFALDVTNNKLYFSKNGTFINSGDPTTGATGTGAVSVTAPSTFASGNYFPAFGDNDTAGETFELNFGSPPFAISSGNADGNGYGNFEYAVPSGYYALNTKNLSEYG